MRILFMTFMISGYLGADPLSYPGSSWDRVSPDTVGFSQSKVERAMDSINKRASCSALVVQGKLIASSGNRWQKHKAWSTGKSVLSTLIGIAYTKGQIESLDDPGIGDGVTIRENLQQNYRGYWRYEAVRGQTKVADIITKYTGDLQSYAQKSLFDPLGMSRTEISSSGWMDTTCEDLARFGLLIARNGEWQGKQIVSPGYLEEAMTPLEDNSAYGYLFWLNRKGRWKSTLGMNGRNSLPVPGAPENMIYAKGYNGQTVLILPDQDIVLVRMGSSSGDTLGVVRDLYNALSKALP